MGSQSYSNKIKEYFKKWPGLYYFVFDYLGPVYFGGIGPKDFLKKYGAGEKCISVGSGARILQKGIINVDIEAYRGVDVVADIKSLPFDDGSLDRVICDQVLEHVDVPGSAIKEICRTMKRGGVLYFSTPFLYPFHSSPVDYQRWTAQGIKKLLGDFEIVDMGTRSGPFSVLTVYFCYLFASLLSLGNEPAYWFFVYALTFVFFPIRYLDFFANRLPFSVNMACVIYCIAKKV